MEGSKALDSKVVENSIQSKIDVIIFLRRFFYLSLVYLVLQLSNVPLVSFLFNLVYFISLPTIE